jgi:phasin family protein
MMNNGKGFFDTDVGKAFAGFAFPGFDVETLMISQRKNFAALTEANQVAAEGVQTLAKRQVEIVNASIEEASAALRELTQPGAPEEKLAKNAELAKSSYEKVLAATRELSELIAKTNSDAFGVLNKRFAESFEEFRDFAAKRGLKAQ